MTGQLTKNQHYVPQGYLRSWQIPYTERVHLSDLKSNTCKERNIEKILAKKYFYEEDISSPDNRIENMLAQGTENDFGVFIKRIREISEHADFSSQYNMKATKEIRDLFNSESQKTLKIFAAYQYLRVPDAIAQKEQELSAQSLGGSMVSLKLNPGQFVEDGYNYVIQRFLKSKLLINLSYDVKFITTDRPFIDPKNSSCSSVFGEDFGEDSNVIGLFPLTPKIGAMFIPEAVQHYYSQRGKPVPHITVNKISPSDARNFNSTMIQAAHRYVVSQDNEPWIPVVAKKRKRKFSE